MVSPHEEPCDRTRGAILPAQLRDISGFRFDRQLLQKLCSKAALTSAGLEVRFRRHDRRGPRRSHRGVAAAAVARTGRSSI